MGVHLELINVGWFIVVNDKGIWWLLIDDGHMIRVYVYVVPMNGNDGFMMVDDGLSSGIPATGKNAVNAVY